MKHSTNSPRRPKKIIISGGPHSGKTTLFEALREHFPGDHFIPEPAESIIDEELETAQLNPDYEPILPTTNYQAFLPKVIGRSLHLERLVPLDVDRVFLDRSLIDNMGYMALRSDMTLEHQLRKLIKHARYDHAFFLERVGVHQTTAIRRESDDVARLIHDHLFVAYTAHMDIHLTIVPPVSIVERVSLVNRAINEKGM